jgi:hypothetical protein
MILMFNFYAKAQNVDSLNIAYAKIDSITKINILPFDALTGKYDFMVIGIEEDTMTDHLSQKAGIEIHWNSNFIDGRYYLILNEKQIYLKSGHENPNPNFLYWLDSLTVNQFEIISKYLLSQDNIGIKKFNSTSRYYTFVFELYRKETVVNNDWANYQFENVTQLIEIINKSLPKDNLIDLPQKTDLINSNLELVHSIKEWEMGRLIPIPIEK